MKRCSSRLPAVCSRYGFQRHEQRFCYIVYVDSNHLQSLFNTAFSTFQRCDFRWLVYLGILVCILNFFYQVEGKQSVQIPAIPALGPSPKSRLVANIEVQGFMPDHLDFVGYFVRYSAHARSLATSPAVIHMPTKTLKWHVTRGPFVHDKSKEIFEQKTYRRLVQIFDAPPETVQAFVNYVNGQLPAGVDLVVERFDWAKVEGLRAQLEAQVEAENKITEDNRILAEGLAQDTTSGGRKHGRKLSYSEDIRERAAEFIKKSKGPSQPAKQKK
ncbi:ribosomal protein S10 domain-containing protein [Chytridium lagenaria]|nr:ribosomal protein S10 domain-containing protein [Chytridium lagenaria]